MTNVPQLFATRLFTIISQALPRFFFVAVVFVVGCSADDDQDVIRFNSELEKDVITKLDLIADEAERIWPGYRLPHVLPIYVVFNDPVIGKDVGYILNPPAKIPDGSLEVDGTFNNLPIYRNDVLVDKVKELGLDSRLFSFDLLVDGVSYFYANQSFQPKNAYLNFKDFDNNNVALFTVHEMFHSFQLEEENWDVSKWNQDFFGYPLTEEIIALNLLLFDISAHAYTDANEQFLEEYISIRQRQMEIDPSSQSLVQNFTLITEMIEGSARYVEHFAALNSIYPTINNDPTHSFKAQLDTVATDALLARQILVQRVPYHAGAIVIKKLVDAGIEVRPAFKEGITPYTLSRNLTAKTNADYAAILQQLKSNVDWSAYEDRASELFNLLN